MPREIQYLILEKCDDKTRRVARLASTAWFRIIDYRDFTLYLTTKSSWRQIVDRLSQYSKPISLRLRKNRVKKIRDFNARLLRLTNLGSIHFEHLKSGDEDQDEWYKLTSLPNLQSVTHSIHTGDYEIPLDALLSLANLTKFIFLHKRRKFPLGAELQEQSDAKMLQSLRTWTNLEDFEFSIRRYDVRDWDTDELFSRDLTRLTRISMAVPENPQKWFMNLENLKFLDFQYLGNQEPSLSLKKFTDLEDLKLTGFYDEINFADVNSTRLTSFETNVTWATQAIFKREIGNLIQLKKLTLLNDSRTILDYSWLADLTALESLDVECFQRVPLEFVPSTVTSLRLEMLADADLTRLSKFGALKGLNIRSLHPGDLSAILMLTTLESLCLKLNSVSTTSLVISCLSNLTSLDVSGLPVEVSRLPKLERATLMYHIHYLHSGFEDLPSLTHLEKICVNPVPIDYTVVSRFTTLKELSLKVIRKVKCEYLTALTNLEFLDVTVESAEDYCRLSGLTKLTSLADLQGTVTSTEVAQLPTSLQFLQVNIPADAPNLIDEIKARLPNLYMHRIGLSPSNAILS